MSDYKPLSMDEQIALQRENTELTALIALADERAKLHKEANDELAAHVERLRKFICQLVPDEGIELRIANGGWVADSARRLLNSNQSQSLQAIRAEVEEEGIGLCADTLSDPDQMLRLHSMPRKYS